MPRPDLAHDPYNERRINISESIHDAIYYLRHGPHRRNDVLATLEEVAGELSIAISSSVLERDPQFERLCRNLELLLPVSIRLLSKHTDRGTDREVADDLISCIPTILQRPDQWNADVKAISDEDGYERHNKCPHHHGNQHHHHKQ
ncbi:hypothetical protein N7475_005274 [Penicillium sp. IBT 31633x]|nr:hypothetical protein N7475_005274 [Penicillium sp. IBT 31633x]